MPRGHGYEATHPLDPADFSAGRDGTGSAGGSNRLPHDHDRMRPPPDNSWIKMDSDGPSIWPLAVPLLLGVGLMILAALLHG
jgi:hypothetical protein